MTTTNSGDGQRANDTHTTAAVPGQAPETGQRSSDTQTGPAGLGPILDSRVLGIAAEQLDDLERVPDRDR